MYFKSYKYMMPLSLLAASCVMGGELKVDINRDSKDNDQYTEIGYVKWSQGIGGGTTASGTTLITRSFTTSDNENVTISFAQTAASQSAGGTGITFLYNASAVSGELDLIGDGLTVDPRTFADGGQLQMTITGLEAGEHSLLTYHNGADGGWSAGAVAPLDVYVNGTHVFDDLPQTVNATDNASASSSYVTFNVSGTTDVTTILFDAEAATGGYTIGNPMINGFEIDTPDIYRSATSPYPADEDGHVDADLKSVMLSWTAALSGDTALHNVYFGTDFDTVKNADTNAAAFLGYQVGTNRTVTVDDPHATYYWRIDVVNTSNEVSGGAVWSFRPRNLAFPGAEGYGRFARGGRGGSVIHVSSLADYASGETPIPGTLRYAVEEETGPRVVIFDIGGLIALSNKLTLSDNYVTIAGQTAPGKGICIRQYALGLSGADDAVVRFIRNRPGDISGTTIDGGGLAGCDHSIMDHCSISWSIDEAFSSRSAKNITLQKTLISEALNIAGHKNYSPGTEHGYAATIGGEAGSFHHNLLAHCEGRNWSMGGGLDANGEWAGRLDIRNNVVYNWDHRTTDGGAHEVNFVANYYKPGAATTLFTALNPTYDNFPGTQQYFMTNNVMPGYFDETNQEDGRTVAGSNGGSVPTEYPVWVDTPFFDSHVETQSAEAAYKRVLSDVGANQPLDEHDVRIIGETLNGTYTYTGTGPYGGDPGLPNSQTDVGGWDTYPTIQRATDWDSDLDGLPDFWEEIIGTDLNSTAGDFSDANADPDIDGYTHLDDYLAWMAQPHQWTAPGFSVSFDLSLLTVGYTSAPVFSVFSPVGGSVALLPDGYTARFTPSGGFTGFAGFTFSVLDDAGDSMTNAVGIIVSEGYYDSRMGIETDEGNINYQFQGQVGYDYTMKYSTDLSTWIPFTNLIANGTWQTNTLPSSISVLPNAYIRAVR